MSKPAASRRSILNKPCGVCLTVYDRYEGFAGSTSWLLHERAAAWCVRLLLFGPGHGYSRVRHPVPGEAGMRRSQMAALVGVGRFSQREHQPHRGHGQSPPRHKWGPATCNLRQAWPWSLDETESGTADFRVKFNIYEAALGSREGSGLTAHAQADAHFRAALAPGGVAAYLLWRFPVGPSALKPGTGFKVSLW